VLIVTIGNPRQDLRGRPHLLSLEREDYYSGSIAVCQPNHEIFSQRKNCKCKLDTPRQKAGHHSPGHGWSRRLCPWPGLAQPSGCVNSIQEGLKKFFRGTVTELSPEPSIQLVSSCKDVLSFWARSHEV